MPRLLAFIFLFLPMFAHAAASDVEIEIPSGVGAFTKKQSWLTFNLAGFAKNETAYRFDEPRSFTKIRNVLQLNNEVNFGRWAKFYASGWAYYDSVYDAFSYETIAARDVRDEKEPLVFVEDIQTCEGGQVFNLTNSDENLQGCPEKDQYRYEMRELYMDLYIKNLDVRVGKQYVVWGVLEGLRVVDEINPMDFRELILPELLDYRVPLWTMKVDYYGDDSSLQLLWIPELVFHQPSAAGSEWELFQVLPATTKPQSYNPIYSEYGVKLTTNILDTEMTFSYFHTWDDYPTTFRIISFLDVSSPDPTNELAILPTYSRMGMFGYTATKEVRGDILKAEFAYVTGKYFAIEDEYEDGFLIGDGEVQRDHIRWGLGYDFSIWGADISPAIAQWMILNYSPNILSRRFDTTFNIFIRKPLQKQSAVFTFLFIHLIEFQETYFKPKMTFNLTNHFQIMLGVDLFFGTRTQFGREFSADDPGGLVDVEQRAQFLGNFRDNRRIFLEFKYNF